MPELENPSGTSPLSQKRIILNTSSIPKINSLDKVGEDTAQPFNKLRQPLKVDLNNKIATNNNFGKPIKESGSSAKIVIWVVIVIVLAIAAYLALKSFLNTPPKDNTNNNQVITTVTPVVDYMSQIVNPEVSTDDKADYKQSLTLFTNGSQEVGTTSTGTFDISKLFVQKYQSFTRLGIEIIALTGEDSLPQISSEYNKLSNEITLSFPSTSTKLDIPFDTEIIVESSTVNTITRINTDNTGIEQFLIKLSQPTIYFLQVAGSADSLMIYLDIKEISVSTTPTVSLAVTTSPVTTLPVTTVIPSVTAIPSIAPTTTGGDVLENAYSKAEQQLHNGLTTNTASFNRFTYSDSSVEFTFQAEVYTGTNGKMPNVTANLVGTILTVDVTNLVSRNATATINFSGARNVQKVDIVSSGNTKKYTFTLTKTKDYRIAYKFNDVYTNALLIQVKN